MVSIRVMAASMLGLGLVACASVLPLQQQAVPAAQEPHILTKYRWERPAPAEGKYRYPVQLEFADGRVMASKLCNRLSGSYQVDGAQLKIDQMVSTMMMCDDPSLMQWERQLATHLPTVRDYVVALTPDSRTPMLTLTFQQGETWTLKGEATPETRYGGQSERVFLEVAPEKVSCTHPLMGKTTCLRVREIQYNEAGIKTSSGQWENFYDTIEGYSFVPGQRQILRLKRFTREPVAADQSRHAYVLDMVVETERVKP